MVLDTGGLLRISLGLVNSSVIRKKMLTALYEDKKKKSHDVEICLKIPQQRKIKWTDEAK